MTSIPRELQARDPLLKDIDGPRIEGALSVKSALGWAHKNDGTHRSGGNDIQSTRYICIQSSEQTKGIDTRGDDSPLSCDANLHHGVDARIYTGFERAFDGRSVLTRDIAAKALLDDREVLVDMDWGQVFDYVRVEGREACVLLS